MRLCMRRLCLRLCRRGPLTEMITNPAAFPTPALSPGMYQYDIERDDSRSRVHLRVDDDFSGLLLINASRVVTLNPTAVRMAHLYLEKQDATSAVNELKATFNARAADIRADYLATVQRIEALINEHSGLCPVCDLDLEMAMPFTANLSAPYRMDLALTYRCNNDCAHCYNARARNYPELDTAGWKRVIDKIWDIRVPHVVFTGGEPTLRGDLVELVAYAQEKGLVTGLNTNARRLADSNLVDALVKAGLDHVQITLESNNPAVHDDMVRAKGAWQDTVAGVRNVVASPLYMMTNTTLLENNAGTLLDILQFLSAEKVPTVGLNALIYSGHGKTVNTGLREEELPALLDKAIAFTQASGQRLIWYTPTQYCHFDPMQLDLGIKGCTAAYYNMCVEPDGQVIPCQSYYEPLGDFASTPWEAIWEHPLSLSLRQRRDVPAGCERCDYFLECGGGCPLAREHQSVKPIYKDLIIQRR